MATVADLTATTTAATQPATTAATGTATPPDFAQTLANWSSNLSNALNMYNAQVQMDHDQQSVAFASSVEAKGNQMVMAVIQNIR